MFILIGLRIALFVSEQEVVTAVAKNRLGGRSVLQGEGCSKLQPEHPITLK
jgi:hypothetical protein